MKPFYALLATAALLLASCQNDQFDNESPVSGVTFTATTEIPDDLTRTSLDADGNVLWKTGDQVSVFQANTLNKPYQVTDDSEGETTASLEEVTTSGGGFVASTELPTNIAYYPYSSKTKIKKGASSDTYALTVSLPATQSYAAGSFGNGAFPMAAVTTSTTDYNLKFKNILGGLKLQLKGTASISSISVTGNSDEILCGTATVTASNAAKPSIVLSDASAKTVTLDCGAGVQLSATTATTFIIALPPMTLTGGFKVVVTDTDNKTMEIKTTKSQTINRSELLKMPEVTVAATGPNTTTHAYVDLGLPSGTLWATCNIGADKPEDYGDYFAWGETTGYTGNTADGRSFDYASYKWCEGTYTSMTKYCTDSSYGTVDNKTELDPADDAATANWGADWQMPSTAQIVELRNSDYTTTSWTTQGGVYGCLITSKNNSNSLFLPAAGCRYDGDLSSAGSYGYYWSRSLYWSSPYAACSLDFNSDFIFCSFYTRYSGLSVRPVRVQKASTHAYVDLGLPSGTLWATCNIGADKPEDYGDYFAWGETTGYNSGSGKTNFDWSTYKYCNGTSATMTKYCTDSSFGTVDNKTELDATDDAATVNWGADWQMPSVAQIQELLNSDNTTTSWTTQSGVYGRLITSKKNGKTLFLPAAGYRYGGNSALYYICSDGYYWSRSLDTYYQDDACYLSFRSDGIGWGIDGNRYYGQSVRPVRVQNN